MNFISLLSQLYLHRLFKSFVMLIRHHTLMIEEVHLAQQSSLAAILFSGGPKSNMLLLDQTLKLNIGALLELLQISFGFKPSSELFIVSRIPMILCDNQSAVLLAQCYYAFKDQAHGDRHLLIFLE